MRVSPLSRNFKPAAPAQAQHSPLPWIKGRGGDNTIRIYIRNGKASKVVCQFGEGMDECWEEHKNADANSDFVVRACNNAQRLVDAAKQVERDWNITRRKHLPSSMAKLREALAELEAKKQK